MENTDNNSKRCKCLSKVQERDIFHRTTFDEEGKPTTLIIWNCPACECSVELTVAREIDPGKLEKEVNDYLAGA